VDRRTSLKWMLAALASGANGMPVSAALVTAPARGYGSDPNLVKAYRSGELWPLTLTLGQRTAAAALCATIIPADGRSPGADDLEVHVFIDEWISAPYPRHVEDRKLVLQGLRWIERESRRRFRKSFAAASETERRAICDEICDLEQAAPARKEAARFFARFRNLTADGFYTTPSGMKDLGFAGNAPSATFEGPPPEALRKAGLT
jgi:hypothetical protein